MPEVPAELADVYGQSLTWEECGNGFDCTDVTVPLDWEQPDGESITLAVKRRAAGDEPVGSLLINPGGPGGSGVQLVESVPLMFSADLLDGYDVVGFDPRGVGASTPVECVSDAELDEMRSEDFDTSTEGGVAAFTESADELAAACEENSGELLAHVDTVSAARDLDVLRHVLEEPRLDYLGYSYGTHLGAVYAEL